eukprot:TRINITY_DN860_c0_g1_i18.p1 TRINITY_DN860_c0_g1~~TRINITY_DN860_c0_g1_i18.p1  ORF type:complete len:657 (-),score=161.50 TRINITY_DN860_c0_g1_i18:1231-3201(-)
MMDFISTLSSNNNNTTNYSPVSTPPCLSPFVDSSSRISPNEFTLVDCEGESLLSLHNSVWFLDLPNSSFSSKVKQGFKILGACVEEVFDEKYITHLLTEQQPHSSSRTSSPITTSPSTTPKISAENNNTCINLPTLAYRAGIKVFYLHANLPWIQQKVLPLTSATIIPMFDHLFPLSNTHTLAPIRFLSSSSPLPPNTTFTLPSISSLTQSIYNTPSPIQCKQLQNVLSTSLSSPIPLPSLASPIPIDIYHSSATPTTPIPSTITPTASLTTPLTTSHSNFSPLTNTQNSSCITTTTTNFQVSTKCPFILVEDMSNFFKPLYKEFPPDLQTVSYTNSQVAHTSPQTSRKNSLTQTPAHSFPTLYFGSSTSNLSSSSSSINRYSATYHLSPFFPTQEPHNSSSLTSKPLANRVTPKSKEDHPTPLPPISFLLQMPTQTQQQYALQSYISNHKVVAPLFSNGGNKNNTTGKETGRHKISFTPYPLTPKDKSKNSHKEQAESHSISRRRKNKDKRKKEGGGYCECCAVRYESLSQHTNTPYHTYFANDDSNYKKIDALMEMIEMRNAPFYYNSSLSTPTTTYTQSLSPHHCNISSHNSINTSIPHKLEGGENSVNQSNIRDHTLASVPIVSSRTTTVSPIYAPSLSQGALPFPIFKGVC